MNATESVSCSRFQTSVTTYLDGALLPAEREAFDEHKCDCDSCREFLNEILDCIEGLGRLQVDDLTAERAAEIVGLLHARPKTKQKPTTPPNDSAEKLLRELTTHSLEQRVILVENSERFRSIELCELAIEQGFALGVQDPSEALSMTTLAVVIAECLQPERYPPGIAFDLRARAYAYLGNARRIRSDLAGSTHAFVAARKNWERGTESLRNEAIICDLEAALLSEKRQYSAAVAMLDRAIKRFALESDRHLEGRTWLSKAWVLGAKGDLADAIRALEIGISRVDTEIEPRLALLAKHNLIVCLREAGRLREIADLLPKATEMHARLGNAVDMVRFKWLEGQLAVDSDELGRAEELFLEVKQFFVEREMAHDVALVSLDLALVYLRQGRIAELKQLAAEMLTIFMALEIHQEAFAALVFCRKAIEAEQMTVGLASELAAYLDKARGQARFGVGLSVSD